MHKKEGFFIEYYFKLASLLQASLKKGLNITLRSLRKSLVVSSLVLALLFTSVFPKNISSLEPKIYAKKEVSVQNQDIDLSQKIKPVVKKHLSVLSWNICFQPSFAKAWQDQIEPWQNRVNQVAKTILEENADIVCLQEVYDYNSAVALTDFLKAGGYKYFYYDIGKKSLKVNSGLFVASKYPVKNAHFTSHKNSKNDLESFFVNKGFFDFEIWTGRQKTAHIFVTHLQHSTNDLNPPKIDQKIRKEQLKAILTEIEKDKDTPVLLVGDFNMTPEEYKSLEEISQFQNFLLQKSKKARSTYSGVLDSDFEAKKKINLTLDYAILSAKQDSAFLFTQVLDRQNKKNGCDILLLSDHFPLKTIVSFP